MFSLTKFELPNNYHVSNFKFELTNTKGGEAWFLICSTKIKLEYYVCIFSILPVANYILKSM
jgi:hypothetical protein